MKQWRMAVVIAGLTEALSLCVFVSAVAQAEDRLPLTEAVRFKQMEKNGSTPEW